MSADDELLLGFYPRTISGLPCLDVQTSHMPHAHLLHMPHASCTQGSLLVPPEENVEQFEWTPGASEEGRAALLDAAHTASETSETTQQAQHVPSHK